MTDRRLNPAERFLETETRRLFGRYQREFVESMNLCPWAKRAEADGEVRLQVVLNEQLDLDACLAAIDIWTESTSPEIGLLIFPRLTLSRVDFERFVSEVVSKDRERTGLTSPAFALAAFHPSAAADTTQAERLIPFIRRTPDPTIQLVRISALERVRQGDVPGTQYFDPKSVDFSDAARVREVFGASQQSLRERVSSSNLESIQRVGVAESTRLLDDIAADRERVHAQYLKLLGESGCARPPGEGRG